MGTAHLDRDEPCAMACWGGLGRALMTGRTLAPWRVGAALGMPSNALALAL